MNAADTRLQQHEQQQQRENQQQQEQQQRSAASVTLAAVTFGFHHCSFVCRRLLGFCFVLVYVGHSPGVYAPASKAKKGLYLNVLLFMALHSMFGRARQTTSLSAAEDTPGNLQWQQRPRSPTLLVIIAKARSSKAVYLEETNDKCTSITSVLKKK